MTAFHDKCTEIRSNESHKIYIKHFHISIYSYTERSINNATEI